jgi:GWxTD domain-containing protein
MDDSRLTASIGARRGAYRFFRGALVVLLGLAAGPAGATQTGRGDFDFHLDSASFRGRDGKALVMVPIRISNSVLKFEPDGAAWKGNLKLNILIVDDAGKELVKETERVALSETDAGRIENPVAYQLLIRQFLLPPGGYWLSYAVEDLNAPKISVVALARKQNMSSVVRRARLSVPEIPDDEAAFSDAWFVWDVDPRAQGVRKYRPNPARMYGLYRDTLTVYLELYLPDQSARAEQFEFRTEIVTPNGDEVRETRRALELPAPGAGRTGTYPVVIREDVTALEAGSYTLYFTFAVDRTTLARVKAGDFSVAWDLRTWETPRREFLAEARFLLGDEEFARFKGKSPGEQEGVLDALWKGFDPVPETGANEAYDAFLDRLAYINAHYSEGGLAIDSRRGEIYLRYGAPDEMVQDVIPFNYDTLAEAEQVVEDPYHPLNMSSSSTKLYATPKSRNSISGGSSSVRYRPEDNTAVPYELWVYHTGGAPIIKRDEVQEADIGMRFLFVDRDGHGQYKLERSSSISNK